MISLVAAAASGLLLALFIGAALMTCVCRTRGVRRLLGSLGKKQMILTFDDGPCEHSTPAVLDVLRQNGVHALFFVTAERARQCPDLIRRMQAEGHQIGLHGLAHRNPWLWGLWPGYARREIAEGVGILRSLGVSPLCFRPAWGRLSPFIALYARRAGLRLFFWNVMAEDWETDATAFSIEQRLRARCGDKAVVCLHDAFHRGPSDAPLRMAAALRHFIPLSLAQGWQFILPEPSAPVFHQEAA